MARANPKEKTAKTSASKKSTPKAGAASKKRVPVARSVSPDEESPPTVCTLLSQSQQTTDEWYKSVRTKNGYASYVKSGKKWLAEWTAEGRVTDSQQDSTGSTEDLNLANAFDSITAETPTALRLLTAYKCDHQGRAFATAEGLRSAFKHYFERVLGCQGDFWKYDSHTKKWEGNPVFESDFKAYFESLKNRDSRTGTTTQALPMLPKDLKVVMEYLDSAEARTHFSPTLRLYYMAFSTTAFTLWTRNDELINLRVKDIIAKQSHFTGIPFLEFRLIFRKTNKDRTKFQSYQIPPDLENPEFDCYTHMSNWLLHLQALSQRPLIDTDFVFPAIASTGQLKFGEPTSRSGFESLMDDIIERSGVMHGRNGKFTTHCFRRGGAQYRFMWAPRKWSLKAVKWWGGWSSNENVGTIMRYLLDELMSYEEGFSDILMSDRASDRHETFMGTQDPSTVVSKGDLQLFESHIVSQLRELLEHHQRNPPIATSIEGPAPSFGVTPMISTPAPIPLHLSTNSRSNLFRPTAHNTIDSSHSIEQLLPSIPAPSRIPETTSLDDVLRYWDEGDVEKGLMVPLKSWSTIYPRSAYKSEAQKLSMIGFVHDEFTVHCGGNWDAFEARFPGLRSRYTKLVKAVRKARIDRGDSKSRRSKISCRS